MQVKIYGISVEDTDKIPMVLYERFEDDIILLGLWSINCVDDNIILSSIDINFSIVLNRYCFFKMELQ